MQRREKKSRTRGKSAGFTRTPCLNLVYHWVLADALAVFAIGSGISRKHAKNKRDKQIARFSQPKVSA
ncbi:hypothetical protein HNQ38_001852 [Desulfovibrio intestinalis]|uniref:Uncharacterized protein n=1 Tax=Desulfovibrio intestinalis TaxID=58621 RepID=A0A7W8C183_9BACT|nr:hypothetical protein [Desulfovibrio intestinalis]